MLKLSIIMPTYNQGNYIQEAILSVLNQKDPNYELIVYDSLSTDETPDILRHFGEEIVWIREKDSGQVDAINKGLKKAKGEILTWLNSDDVYLPFAFNYVRKSFEKAPYLDFVYGDALEIDSLSNIITPNLFTEDYNADRYLYSHNFICQPTMFFKKTSLTKVGLLRKDLKWIMDYEWFSRFFVLGLKGKRIPHFLSANRNYPQTKTNSGGYRRYMEIMKVIYHRPAKNFLIRKATWVYSLEHIIKTINNLLENWNPESIFYYKLKEINYYLSEKFLHLVYPNSKDEIIKRFNEQILAQGKNIKEIWRNSLS